MADDIHPLKGHDPPDFGKEPIETYKHTDPAESEIEDGQPGIAGLEIVLLVHEQVKLPVFPHIPLRPDQNSRIEKALPFSLAKTGDDMEPKLIAFVFQVTDESAFSYGFRAIPRLLLGTEIVTGIAQLRKDSDVRPLALLNQRIHPADALIPVSQGRGKLDETHFHHFSCLPFLSTAVSAA
jgi:hypothetical protein